MKYCFIIPKTFFSHNTRFSIGYIEGVIFTNFYASVTQGLVSVCELLLMRTKGAEMGGI